MSATLLALTFMVTACSGTEDGPEAGPGPSTPPEAGQLGPVAKASGTPVKVGMIDDGQSANINNAINVPVAQATVKWLNEHQNGLAGHPIELVTCVTGGDPSKATDCANQVVKDGVVGVVVAASSQVAGIWAVLQPAKIPVMFFGTSNPRIIQDAQSSFVLGSASASLLDGPASIAKEKGKTTVTGVVIDVPAATDAYKGGLVDEYAKKGLKLEVVPVPAGTADMTPQMQQVVSSNKDGVVRVTGNDAFCIAAFNGLRTAGFAGTVEAVPQCITEATRKAVPGEFLKGIRISATSPFQDKSDESVKQYYAVIDAFGAADVDKSDANGIVAFSTVASFAIAAKDLKGDVTPASVTAAIKAMKQSVMPGTGGQGFRCNGKADPAGPAVCSHSMLSATLDDKGSPAAYTKVNDTPIPD